MPVMDGIAATQAIRSELPDTEVDRPDQRSRRLLCCRRCEGRRYRLPPQGHEGRGSVPGDQSRGPGASATRATGRRAPRPRGPDTRRGADSPERTGDGSTAADRQGKANKEIAAELTIGEKTVKTHVSSILNKLGRSEPYAGRALRGSVRHRSAGIGLTAVVDDHGDAKAARSCERGLQAMI